ncbi:hypothetical protein FXO38_24751 [Capsicum annuum]|uniref:putative F-box protein At1g49610 n=1 Tax=Capsicum annuum TaxID=4072 RepID=UPI001FB0B3FF|nr:putative F-box protein At1g49610 [Capsicum annuum]XP_016582457.2 putative F-box protein At1g49610 [Capsicum annuum]KAF3635163.1 hypothetical protein FXO38_24751 [Capsicum annuum]
MDRLSELPEPIQLHILSFLPMRYVVRTVILCKHWQRLWTNVQELYFSTEGFFPYEKYLAFVNRALICRGTCKIRRLRIELYLNALSPKDYEGWISYSATNNVEDLFLEFDTYYYEWLPPQCLYCNSSLKTLKLWGCRFVPDMQIRWNTLTKLSLWFSVLRNESFREIMVGAPKLEFFELFSCWGYNNLTFDSPCLRTVNVCEYETIDYENDEHDHGPILRISAPNVRSLQLTGALYRKCVLMNVSSVVHATLDFRPYIKPFREEKLKWQKENLMELGRSLKHVESLTLGIWCIEVLAQRERRRIPPQISTNKCATLNIHMKEEDLLGIVNLLKGSPNLQTLIIDMEPKFWEEPRVPDLTDSENFCIDNVANYVASQAEHVKCLLHHLKTVKITQFVEQHSVLPFVEFILKKGRVLENLVIIAKRGLDENSEEYLRIVKRWGFYEEENSPKSLLKVAQRLLSIPRASSRAVITLRSRYTL